MGRLARKKSHTAAPWRSRIVGEGDEAPETLAAHPQNWRVHPPAQQRAMTGVLEEVGWVQRIIVNRRTGRLVDRHLRLALAVQRQEPLVPVLYVDLDEREEHIVLATLDPMAALATADKEQLAAVLGCAETEAAAVQALLATVRRAAHLPEVEGQTDPEAVPDPPDTPTTQSGDLWLLGDHRVLCGDSTKAEDVARLCGDEVPEMCVTDPPYGVEYDPAWRDVAAAKGLLSFGERRTGSVTNDDCADWRATWALFGGDVIYSWHPAGATSLVHAEALLASGFAVRMQIIWAKRHMPIGRGDYHVRHEPCWYAVRHGKPSHRNDDRTQTTLWDIGLDKNVEGGHSTQKPVECMARPMRNHDLTSCYDPFLGSGTTLIAAEQLGRRCYALEIEPRYVDVAVKRWELFTGKTAQRVPA